MKKLLALLLAFCLILGLAACGPKTPVDNTGDSTTTTGDNNENNNNNNNNNNANVGDKPYAGKELQVWAMVGPEYESEDKIQANVWLWMVRAAMDEWAALNDVTLKYVSNYDQKQMLSNLNSGSKPDFLFAINAFPEIANLKLVQNLTEDQQEKIIDIIGDTWFTTFRGDVYGVQAPWGGTNLVYYNQTMMENYGVKTPKEHVEEGTWTWENFFKLCEECTKDTDGDGVLDTIGSTTFSTSSFSGGTYHEDKETGKLVSDMGTPRIRKYVDYIYDAVVNKKSVINKYIHASSMNAPRVAMSISDAEPYNFQHLYKTLANGDVLACAQLPVENAGDANKMGITNYNFAIPNGSDEADAAVDMICYIMKAGMKWMADHSEGMFTTEYEGIIGACDYSKAWLDLYNDFLEERDEEFADLSGEFDEEFYGDLLNEYLNTEKAFGGAYTGLAHPLQGAKADAYDFSSIFTMPPASSMPILTNGQQALIDNYNNMYIVD